MEVIGAIFLILWLIDLCSGGGVGKAFNDASAERQERIERQDEIERLTLSQLREQESEETPGETTITVKRNNAMWS